MNRDCRHHSEYEPPWMCACTRYAVEEAIHVLEMTRENPGDKAVDVAVALTWLRRVIAKYSSKNRWQEEK